MSGTAVVRAAEDVKSQVLEVAAAMLGADTGGLVLGDERVTAPDGSSATLADINLRSLYGADQRQIAATASFVPEESPPPFTATFVEVAVDLDTGKVEILDYVVAVDCGRAINPLMAEGQMEGAIANGIGYALTEEMLFDDRGCARNPDMARYKIPGPLDLPPIRVILVEGHDPTGPMGAKSVGEIGINGPIPTIANAIHDAVGIRLTETPFTPEKVWRALRDAGIE